MTAPQTKEDGGRVRFPALDPEPAHRPVPWRLLASVAVVALVAAGIAKLSFALGSQSHPRTGSMAAGRPPTTAGGPGARQNGPSALSVRGQILTETPAGKLILANADDMRVTRLRGLGQFPPTPPLASPDERYLFDTNERVISLAKPGHPAVLRTPLNFPSHVLPAVLGPFADHDQYLILRPSDYGVPSLSMPVDLGSIATGKTIRLGRGDGAAGDPQRIGAFVAVASPLAQVGASAALFPDSRVELRDAGAKPEVLATASQLSRAIGEPSRAKVSLSPFPSPDGGKVAVEVTPLTPRALSAIVVMSRSGRVLDSVPLALGADSNVFWNPAGTEFAYLAPSSFGQSLTVTTLGGGTQTQAIPVLSRPVYYRTCVWSPDGGAIVCADSKGAHWAIAHTSGGLMITSAGRGIPIAWFR